MDIAFFNYGVILDILSIVVVLVFLTPASLFICECTSFLLWVLCVQRVLTHMHLTKTRHPFYLYC